MSRRVVVKVRDMGDGVWRATYPGGVVEVCKGRRKLDRSIRNWVHKVVTEGDKIASLAVEWED